MKRHRIVLDANVLISAILFGGPPREVLELAISGTIDCSLSLECAISARAVFIVSGDRHLLDLAKCRDVLIVRPSDYLKTIRTTIDTPTRKSSVFRDARRRRRWPSFSARCPFLALWTPQSLASGGRQRHKAKPQNRQVFPYQAHRPAQRRNARQRAANIASSGC